MASGREAQEPDRQGAASCYQQRQFDEALRIFRCCQSHISSA
jgi:hypothetical protein